MSEPQERRRYTRIDFASDAELVQGESRYNVHLIDISLNGVLVETPEDYTLKTDQAVTINITLADEISIQMLTQLAHNSNQMLGFKCDSIDMESMTHLRRLMELNLEDVKAPERVLEELIDATPT